MPVTTTCAECAHLMALPFEAHGPPPLWAARPINSGPARAVVKMRRNQPDSPPQSPRRTARTSMVSSDHSPTLQVGGKIIAESDRDFSRPHDVVS